MAATRRTTGRSAERLTRRLPRVLATLACAAGCASPDSSTAAVDARTPPDVGATFDVTGDRARALDDGAADATAPADLPNASDLQVPDAPAEDAVAPADANPGDATDGPAPDAATAAIAAPPETWTWVPFDDAYCGTGGATGLGVNLTTRSRHVFIYLEGGGACWDANTCFTIRSAANIDATIDAAAFASRVTAIAPLTLFSRSNPANPFRDASWVYVPYCTGDVHWGRNVTSYATPSGPRAVHHVGALNMRAFLRRLAPTFADADRVWLTGSSAGGYGASVNWRQVQDAMPRARVDLLSDSGPLVTPPAPLYATWLGAWDPLEPDDCANCRDRMENLAVYYALRYGTTRRAGLLTFTQDTTLSIFYGVPGSVFEALQSVLLATAYGPVPSFNAFELAGSSHTMFASPDRHTARDGTTALQWITQMVTDDPAWREERP